MSPRNHALDGVQMPPLKGQFWGIRAAHCEVLGLSAVSCAKQLNRSTWGLGYGLGWANEAWGPDPPWKGAIIREKDMPGHAHRHSTVSCAKWLNWSICRMDYGLGWACRKYKFNCIRQVAPMCPYRRAHWCHLANMILPSFCRGSVDINLMSNYFDHLFHLFCAHLDGTCCGGRILKCYPFSNFSKI